MEQPVTGENVQALIIGAAQRLDAEAINKILATQNPRSAASACEKTQGELYWNIKNIPAMVLLSQTGIKNLLDSAGRCTDPAEADNLRSAAKAMSFNLASFTWPGWGEPGWVITPADLAAGLEAAKLNLQLANELKKPQKAKANAYWVLGAQQIAGKDYVAAAESFRIGQTHAANAHEAVQGRMLEGYEFLAQVLGEPADKEIRSNFDRIVSALRQENNEDATEYANQLEKALPYFQRS